MLIFMRSYCSAKTVIYFVAKREKVPVVIGFVARGKNWGKGGGRIFFGGRYFWENFWVNTTLVDI